MCVFVFVFVFVCVCVFFLAQNHKMVQMDQTAADWHLALSNAISIGKLKCFGKEFLMVTVDLTEKDGSTQVVATK